MGESTENKEPLMQSLNEQVPQNKIPLKEEETLEGHIVALGV